MTNKQVKFGRGKRSRKVKQVDDEYERGNDTRRPVLLSCDDVDRMAIESSRARLISHLISKSDNHNSREFSSKEFAVREFASREFVSREFASREYASREFASYYHGSSRCLDPPYSITSHADRMSVPQLPQKVIPAYPSMIQSSRWCPYAPSSQSSEVDVIVRRKYVCKCGKCTSNHCPAKHSCPRPKPRVFKDNIMTFCDQYTMTRDMNDTGCGRTPTPSTPKCSDLATCPPSVVAIREPPGKLVQEMYSRKCRPVPILKKTCNDPLFYDYCPKRLMSNNFQGGAALSCHPSRSSSIKSFYKQAKKACAKCKAKLVSRKNLYNEGISDRIANKYPKAVPLPACSRNSLSSRCGSDVYIPHAHRNDSKYHNCCKKGPPKRHVCDKEMKRCNGGLPSTKVVCKTYASKNCKRCKEPPRCIRLPKKVLTSERVIEGCTEKHSGEIVPRR